MSELRTLPITIPKEEIEQFCQRHPPYPQTVYNRQGKSCVWE